MAFILSEGRHKDLVKAFKTYRKYIEKNRPLLPRSVYELASSEWYFNVADHRCPHDAWLEKLSVYELSSGDRNQYRTTEIRVKLLGAYHDGFIELTYSDVDSFSIDAFSVKAGHSDWKYDEFRVSESGGFVHEIEWSGYGNSAHWLISAKDLSFRWCEFNDA